MKPVLRVAGVIAACLCVFLFSGGDAWAKTKSKANTAKKAAKAPAKATEKSSAKSAAAETSPTPQGPRGAKVSSAQNAPKYMPIQATIGTLGLFTMDTEIGRAHV